MFGIGKIKDRLFENIWRIDTVILGIKNQLKSLQSTNDKRYNEIKESLQKHLKMLELLQEQIKLTPATGDLVSCDTCKCLLHKKDAIKGESRIVKRNGCCVYFNGKYYKNYECTEEYKDEAIEEVYYCNKCGGKSEKNRNKKARSTVVKTNKK